MTLLFMDGFDDLYEDDDLLKKWHRYIIGYSKPIVVLPTGGRFGDGCIQNIENYTHIEYRFDTAETEAICGFAFKRNGTGTNNSSGICNFKYNYGTYLGNLKIDIAGHLFWDGYYSLDSSFSTNVIRPDIWYYIEIRLLLDNTVGEIEVKVNGVQWLYAIGDTIYISQNEINSFCIAGPTLGTFYFDDVYILNTSGSNNNDFLGDVRVLPLKPDGAGNYAQFTPSSGDNYACVDEDDWSGSDYVQTTTDGQIDTHTYAAVPSDLGTIYGVQLCNGSKKLVESDGTEIKHVVRKNSTDYVSDAKDISDDVEVALNMYELDPNDSNPWTKAKLDATEFGYQSVIP